MTEEIVKQLREQIEEASEELLRAVAEELPAGPSTKIKNALHVLWAAIEPLLSHAAAIDLDEEEADGDAAHILQHSIAQACLELETIENALDRVLQISQEYPLLYALQGVRKRLELAHNSAPFLAKVIAQADERRAASGGAA